MCRYASLPETISKFRGYYDQQAALASQGWGDYENDYLTYIIAFLSLLYLSFRAVLPLSAPENIPMKADPLPKKSSTPKPAAPRRSTKRALVEELVLGSGQPISKADICAALPQVSPTTVEAALGTMVKNGTVKRIGSTRTAKYIKN